MGSNGLDKISDYRRPGFNLQVTCRHRATIAAGALNDKRRKQRRSLKMI
jgi:hypothetical protein